MQNRENIKQTVKDYIMEEFLVDEDPDSLDETTPLISGGILDSIATIKLITFLEEKYGVEFKPHEVSVDHLNTLQDITSFVQSKLS